MALETSPFVVLSYVSGPALLTNAIVLALVIGLVGGLFPAIRAARLPIAAALRET